MRSPRAVVVSPHRPSLVVSVGWGHHRYRHPGIAVLNPERDVLNTQMDRHG